MVSFWWKCGSTVDREKMGLRSLMSLLVSSGRFLFLSSWTFRRGGTWSTIDKTGRLGDNGIMENLDNHAPLTDAQIKYCTVDLCFTIATLPPIHFCTFAFIGQAISAKVFHQIHWFTYMIDCKSVENEEWSRLYENDASIQQRPTLGLPDVFLWGYNALLR